MFKAGPSYYQSAKAKLSGGASKHKISVTGHTSLMLSPPRCSVVHSCRWTNAVHVVYTLTYKLGEHNPPPPPPGWLARSRATCHHDTQANAATSRTWIRQKSYTGFHYVAAAVMETRQVCCNNELFQM